MQGGSEMKTLPRINRAAGRWLSVILACVIATTMLPAGPVRMQSDSRLFPETGKTVRGLFLAYWNEHGSLAQQGFPISEEMQERSDTDGKTYTVQYFERAVFEAHPENAAPYNVLLSLLGNFRYKEQYPNGAPNQKASTQSNARLFPETGKHLGGTFLTYWNEHGGLAQQGFPVSEEFQEKSPLDGKTYTVQYFERAVFEAHPENQPPYNVLLSQLGTFQYGAKYAAANLTLDQFYDKVFYDIGLRDPENFTSLGLPRSLKPDLRNDRLTNVSDAYLHQTYALERQFRQQLGKYDFKQQTPKQQISTGTLAWYLDDAIMGEEFMYHDYTLNPMYGAQVILHDLMTILHPLTDKRDAEDYVTRLQAFGPRIDGVLEQMRLREQKGIFMPAWMIDEAIGQMRGMTPANVKSSDFYTIFTGKVGALNNISSGDKQTLYAAAEKAITDDVYPAYRKLIDYLSGIRSRGRTTDGVWDLPNGDAYYRYLVHHHTGTDTSPEEIHNLGLREVARIQGEIRKALDDLGYKNMGLREGMQAATQAAGFYQTGTPSGKQEVLDAFKSIIDRAKNNLSSQFDLVPKVPLEVRAVPAAQEAGSPGGYYFQPSLDGTRPGIFYANLGRPTYPKYNMATLAYHEAIPGHHFQLGTQVELQNVPLFQRASVFPLPTSYVEGWALYAEKLAGEAGFYRDDSYGNIGKLRAELFRATRLVVDTGIHWKHWSRQQAIDYMDEANGTAGGAYTGEVERYIAWPGQALAYKIGELKILELREQARTQLGGKFNIKEFHNAVLGSGSLPLPVLAKAVEQYISSK
jgi:uncharacterized protein (DUF885 family)